MDFDALVLAIKDALVLPRDWSFGVGEKSVRVNLAGLTVPVDSNTSTDAKVIVDFSQSGSFENLISVVQAAIVDINEIAPGVSVTGYSMEELDRTIRTLRVTFTLSYEVPV
jgi:hypothetical protein